MTASVTATEQLRDLPCACASLRRAARAVTRTYERSMKYTGVTPTQFTLLQALDLAGPTPQGKLGDILSLESNTLTRMLRLLVRRRFIERRAGADGRQIVWALTPQGERKFKTATPAWKRAQSTLRNRIGTARWNRLVGDLTAIATAAALRPGKRAPSLLEETIRRQ